MKYQLKHILSAVLVMLLALCAAFPAGAEVVNDAALGISFDKPDGYVVRHIDAHSGPLPFMLIRKGGSEIKILRLTTLLPTDWTDATLRAAVENVIGSYAKSRRGSIDPDWQLEKLDYRAGWQAQLSGIDDKGRLIDGGLITLIPSGEILFAVLYFDPIDQFDEHAADYRHLLTTLRVPGDAPPDKEFPWIWIAIGGLAVALIVTGVLLRVKK